MPSDFIDRSRRLAVLGLLSILVGGANLALGALQVLMLLVPSSPGGSAGLDARAAATGVLLHAALGGAFVAVGIGSMRRRRWARPLMLTLAWTWFLGGLIALPILPGLTDAALGTNGLIPPEVVLGVKIVLLVLGTLFGVLLPAVFIRVYNDPDVERTCEAHDPVSAWTERCPPSVLGVSLGLAALGVLCLPLALRPVVPLFGMLLTGWPAATALLVCAALSGWLALATYRLQPIAWWGATVLLTGGGLSAALTFLRVAPAGYYRAMGYPAEQVALLESSGAIGSTLTVSVTLLMTLATLIFMVAIKKHFVQD